ncbi:MAG: UDP-2,3-diacylglucosamine diphosphatase LpxI [Kiritimatiellae bacterium]|nr:UDP-2,3-diacylglucosamine diphosphatase LpxI [Kiritimatiellia bacterium]
MTCDKLVVIAGSGQYPRLLIEGAKRAGVRRMDCIAVKGSTARATCAAADNVHWISIGTIAEGIRWCGANGYEGAFLAGQVNPLSLFRGRFDEEVKRWLSELKVKNAHSIFGKLAEKFADVGVPILPASCFMDEHIPGEGTLTKRGLTSDEESDVRHAVNVVRDIGHLDVGQTVMVKSGMVLSVEAFEGTNAAVKRGGRLGGRGSIVFKAAREGHDMRFDIPVVGLKTLKVLHWAGATALAFQAGRLVMLNRKEVIDYADAHGIAIVGIASGLEPAPLRP